LGFHRVAGVVLIVGSILFFLAAFSPISSRVFPEPDAAKRLQVIIEGRRAWTVAQTLFALGSIVAAIGIGLASYHFRSTPNSATAVLGSAAIVIGAGLWCWHVHLRTLDPQAFAEGSLPAWHFIAYTVLTQAGLAAFGVYLLRTGLQSWVGWAVIGGSALFFVAYLVFKDMPPFVYYILTLLIGVMIYRGG
jgi:hypothetical protein